MKALLLNCSLEKGHNETETETLLNKSALVFQKEQVDIERVHLRDFQITFGITSNLDGNDDWPFIFKKICEADIILFATPITLGEKSSIATLIIERLQGYHDMKNKKGQQLFYNKVGGVIAVEQGEGGARLAVQSIIYSLSMLGFTIPPHSSTICSDPYDTDSTAQTGQKVFRMCSNLINFAEIFDFSPIPLIEDTSQV
ncbi:NAD(P)H-dependent oxidoreductase [Halobacillus sp. A1]|uniref:flavodoxin family protein n=1 Tax=Halobacillus sp. A1 TaxID=2880262 RepID=UPI0020A65B76|nr:NAD(P)H-dependent oxidoreductase [Halobacillus sp. A1]MCP3032423.1 NAD(P)H-dependent oxidoreductase [Halobacillus sp. A1]